MHLWQILSLFAIVVIYSVLLMPVSHSTDYFKIPEQHRRPASSLSDFYTNHSKLVVEPYLTTRLKYKKQYHVPSVMVDGFHSYLPENAMWRNGIVEISDDVKLLNDIEKNKS